MSITSPEAPTPATAEALKQGLASEGIELDAESGQIILSGDSLALTKLLVCTLYANPRKEHKDEFDRAQTTQKRSGGKIPLEDPRKLTLFNLREILRLLSREGVETNFLFDTTKRQIFPRFFNDEVQGDKVKIRITSGGSESGYDISEGFEILSAGLSLLKRQIINF